MSKSFNLLGFKVRELPPAMHYTVEDMGGHSLVFVTSKELTSTDVNPHDSRLSIPGRDWRMLWGLLSEDEQMKVRAEGYNTEVVDPEGRRHKMKLKAWKSWNGKLVLIDGWNDLVILNDLEGEMHCIELWSFRMDSQMGSKMSFALYVERSEDHP